MFLVLSTLMRKDDSVYGIIQFHGVTGRLSLKVSEATSGSLLSQQHERQRRHHTALSRQRLQDHTTITLSGLFTIPLTLRVRFWQGLSGHQMHHCRFAERKF